VFDYNTAPFFQSFVEVSVEPDQMIVRPYGVHGRLRWADMDRSEPGDAPDGFVEWTVARRP
jgi:hypothetical protein